MILEQTLNGGGAVSLTGNTTRATRTVAAHAPYMDDAWNGRGYVMDSGSVTLAAANASAAALGTAKFINGFLNPPGSGKNAVIWDARIATVSGTPAGPFFWNYFNLAKSLSNTTTGTIRNLLLGGPGSSMVAATGVVLATSPAQTDALLQLAALGGPAAVAAGAGLYDAYEDVGGRIIVPPGFLIGLMATGAGTTHVVQSTLRWAEIGISQV